MKNDIMHRLQQEANDERLRLLDERGATYEKNEDRSGRTVTGWFLDGCYLGETLKDAVDAIGS